MLNKFTAGRVFIEGRCAVVDSYYRPTRAEISLDALTDNIRSFRNRLPQPIRLMAVVKANAYGHGAVQVAREAAACGVDYLAVAFLDEAIELREAGIPTPILVLGYTGPEGVAAAARHRVTLTVYSEEVLQAISRNAAEGSPGNAPPIHIHIKVDTGMGRIGLPTEESAIRFVRQALAAPGVVVEGLFTHYARADERDKRAVREQYERFARLVARLGEEGIRLPCVHAGNSATGIDTPDYACNMVRLGISMYGLYPSAEVNRQQIRLRPVLTLKTAIVMCKQLPPGSGVSYGSIYRTEGQEMIATLPIGYADGFTRMLTGHAEALVRGRRVPVVGRICMDQCMINVTSVAGVSVGDEVILIGEQQGERIRADDLADRLGTINYEIPCMISRRVPRVYIRHGQVVECRNDLT